MRQGTVGVLLNDFNRMKPRLLAQQDLNTQDGVAARINLDFMPQLIEMLQREQRRNTNPRWQMQAVAGVISMIALHTVRETLDPATQRAGFDMLLSAINETVREQLAHSGANSLIITGRG